MAQPSMGQPAESTTQPVTEIKLDLQKAKPLAQWTGLARSYQVSSPRDFVPGQLADGYLGDYVLENDAIKLIVARPGKPTVGSVRSGTVLDVVLKSDPLDHLNCINLIPDLESTTSEIIYSDAKCEVLQGTTATLTMRGKARGLENQKPDADSGIEVTTRYSLPANSGVVLIESTFRNDGAAPVMIYPGDVADWATATVFAEGQGIPRGTSTTSATFVAAFADHFSAAIVTSAPGQEQGIRTARDIVTLAPAAATGQIDSDTRKVTAMASRLAIAPEPEPTPAAHAEDATLPPAVRNMIMEVRKGTAPVPETYYGLAEEALRSPSTTNPLSGTPTGYLEALAEGKRARDKRASALPPKPEPRNGIELARGSSFAYSRHLVVSDGELGRIAEFAYRSKNVATGFVAGLATETGTDAPLENADIFISGGPGWDGKTAAPAFCKVRTASDGTFTARVRPGQYSISGAINGRSLISGAQLVTVTAKSAPQIAILSFSRESTVRVAVLESESATTAPLPSKVTIVPRMGTLPVNFASSHSASKGIRNVYYMPYGAASIPLSPGRYQLVFSRGIEYDIVKREVTVNPGTNQTIVVSLPHVLKGQIPDWLSMDAGLVTTASANGYGSPENRVVQAVCEGVHAIVSGDYDSATDLQAVVEKMELSQWIRASEVCVFCS